MLNVETKLFALLGSPVKYSLSPKMHNNWFKENNLDCAYFAFDVSPQNLGQTLKILKSLNFCGFNVTAPHKVTVMKYIDNFDKTAKAVENVNTILIKGGKICGYNTDCLGLDRDFLANKINIKGKKVFVLGAGGAAKSVLYVMTKNKASQVCIANRTKSKAFALAKKFNCQAIDLKDATAFTKEADILINASSCGFSPKDILPFEADAVKKGAIVYDLIYNKETPMIKLAKENKIKFFTGKGLLIYQGICAFEIWTGKKPSAQSALRILKNY